MSDLKKAPLDLVPLQALVGAARVFEHGNSKVVNGKQREPGDFINRPLDGAFFASFVRHTMEVQLLQGIVNADSLSRRDKDTDLPVIDHIITNALIIRAMLIRDGKLPVDPGPGKSTRNEMLRGLGDAVLLGADFVDDVSTNLAASMVPPEPPRWLGTRRCRGCSDCAMGGSSTDCKPGNYAEPENKGETPRVTDDNDPVPGARW